MRVKRNGKIRMSSPEAIKEGSKSHIAGQSIIIYLGFASHTLRDVHSSGVRAWSLRMMIGVRGHKRTCKNVPRVQPASQPGLLSFDQIQAGASQVIRGPPAPCAHVYSRVQKNKASQKSVDRYRTLMFVYTYPKSADR